MKKYVPIPRELEAEQVQKKTRVNVIGLLGDVHTRYVQPGEWILYRENACYPEVMNDEDFRKKYEEVK